MPFCMESKDQPLTICIYTFYIPNITNNGCFRSTANYIFGIFALVPLVVLRTHTFVSYFHTLFTLAYYTCD